jgi:hypothetical protein
MTLRLFVLIMLTGVLISCDSEEETLLKNPVQINNYFPISQFIDGQIPLLDGQVVRKEVDINGERHQVEQVLNERDWREEFDWFIQSDINKASLAQSYHIEEMGNLVSYTLKPGEKGTLQKMEVLYDGDQVKEINILSSRKNTFYRSNASSRLTTGEDGVINTYRMESTQKVWFLDPNKLLVVSEVQRK